jgi:hypothetical protein
MRWGWAMLNVFLVNMAWCVLRMEMEEAISRY